MTELLEIGDTLCVDSVRHGAIGMECTTKEQIEMYYSELESKGFYFKKKAAMAADKVTLK